jgi:predicted aldo/keto reductase-like oxidoreductase
VLKPEILMESKNNVSRRGFLKTTGAAVAGGGLVSASPHVESERGASDQEVRVREFRTLGRTGFEVSDIGFGGGFLNNTNVMEVALDMGVNYIDTAEHYSNGQSERAVGQAIQGRDRSSFFLTSKLNLTFGGGGEFEVLKRRFHQCLERLQTDYVDCLMIHMTPVAVQVKHEPYHRLIEELKAEGKVRFSGLSNHGTEHSVYGRTEDTMEDVIGAAVEDGRFDVALFVYNFLQKEQGERVIEMCRSKNMGVTLMKTDPVNVNVRVAEANEQRRQSGREIPEAVQRLADDYDAFAAGAAEFRQRHGLNSTEEVRQAATKFVLNNSGVHCVCPTINTFDALESFVSLSGLRLSETDGSMLDSYGTLLGRFYCRHACKVCEPSCPNKVPVNTILRYNHYFEAHGREKHAMEKYARLATARADACENCVGQCESVCPHGVPTRTMLARAHRNLVLG